MPEWLEEYATGSYADHVAIGIIDSDHPDVHTPSAMFQPHVLEQAAAGAKENGFERVGLQLIPAPHDDGDESHILVLRNQLDGELAVVAAPVIPSDEDDQTRVGDHE